MKMCKENKFCALVGFGYWGKNIFRNLYELGYLRTACESNKKLVSDFQTQFPDVHYTNSFEDVLADPLIKAVLIATPAATHFDFVKRALLAHKDVFVEKPLSLTVQEGEELTKLADKTKRVLMVGHILQYHPAVLKLKEILNAGQLGKIRYIYSNRLNIGKLRTEENILWSFAPHDISVILMLLGEEPSKVGAFSAQYLNKDVNDVTMTSLEFSNGVKGHVFVSWLHPYKEQKLIVVGSKAMAVFDDMAKDKLLLYPHTITWKEGKIPVAQKADFQVIPFEQGEPLKREMEHFVDCVCSRKTPRTDGKEGLTVLRVLEKAEQSGNLSATAAKNDLPSDVFVHQTAYVDSQVTIGEKTKIWHFSHLLKNTSVGKNCVIGQNVVIGPDVRIGDQCKIQNNVSLYKGVTLEDDVFCGPSCVFTNVYTPRAFIERKHEFRNTLVKRGATIGANATIVCGATLGAYSFIGAGAVVKEDVADYALVVGIPARQIGWVCKCGIRLKTGRSKTIACDSCGSKYRLQSNKLAAERA